MRRKLTEQRFEMNSNTEVIIKSKQKGVDLYKVKVTVVHELVSTHPIVPKNQDEVFNLVQNIPLEDDQTALFSDQQINEVE